MNIMARRLMVAGLTAGLLLSTLTAHAGKSPGSRSRSISFSSSKGSAVLSSPRPSTSGPVNYKSAVPVTPVNRYNSREFKKTTVTVLFCLDRKPFLQKNCRRLYGRENKKAQAGWEPHCWSGC